MSGSKMEPNISVEGHPTDSLQAFLRSFFKLESHNALDDLTAPLGGFRNAATIGSTALGEPCPREDFDLHTADFDKRVTERDVLIAAAAFYRQVHGVTKITISDLGTLIYQSESGSFNSVIVTELDGKIAITIRSY